MDEQAENAHKRRLLKEKWNKMKSQHDVTSIHFADNIDADRKNFVQSTQQFEIQRGMRHLSDDVSRNVRRQR